MFPTLLLQPHPSPKGAVSAQNRAGTGHEHSLSSADRSKSGSFAQILSLMTGSNQQHLPIDEVSMEDTTFDLALAEDGVNDLLALAQWVGLDGDNLRELLPELLDRLNSLSGLEAPRLEEELLQESRTFNGQTLETIISQLEELLAAIKELSSSASGKPSLYQGLSLPEGAQLIQPGQDGQSNGELTKLAASGQIGETDSRTGERSSFASAHGNLGEEMTGGWPGSRKTPLAGPTSSELAQGGQGERGAEGFQATFSGPGVTSPPGQGDGLGGQAPVQSTGSLEDLQPLRSTSIPGSLNPEKGESSQVPTARYSFLVEDLHQIIRMRLINGVGGLSQLKVKIIPEHLGEIDIHLTSQDGKVTIQLMASSRLAMEALDRHLYQLQAVLYQQGVQVDRIEVMEQTQHGQMLSAGEGEAHEETQHHQEERGASRKESRQQEAELPFTLEAEEDENSVVNYTV